MPAGSISLDDVNQRRMLDQLNRFYPQIGWGGFGGMQPGWWDTEVSLGGIARDIFGIPDAPREVVSPVVISERPRTIVPGSPGNESISKSPDLPEGFYRCEINGEERICQEPPEGGWQPINLPPIDEEVWGDIIRSPVPVPVDDQEFEEEEESVAHTWLHAGTQIVESIWGDEKPQVYDTGSSFVPVGTGDPTYNGTAWAAAQKKKGCRRRRRRLLTDRDFDDLNRIATLPNNQNVRVVLAKAIGRR